VVKKLLTEATRGCNHPKKNSTLTKGQAFTPKLRKIKTPQDSDRRETTHALSSACPAIDRGISTTTKIICAFYYSPKIGIQAAREKKRLKAQRHQTSMLLGGVALRAGNLNRPAR
jgi:hypothetical protein